MLTHETAEVAIELTYDPTVPLYSISLTQPRGFAPSSVFAMQFNGPMPLGISTDQHQLRNRGRTLTVIYSGFSNILNGLQFNDIVTATLGMQRIEIPLLNATIQFAAFRAFDVLRAA